MGLFPLTESSGLLEDSNCNIGIAKAAVLPVPVCAQPNRSLPERTGGIAFSWMGVGLVYPSDSSAVRIGSIKFNSVNNKLILFNDYLAR